MIRLPEKLYPVGIQTFSEIIGKNYVYVDKTEYVYRMTHGGAKYIFLSRPRRFGKSLLVSTLQAYFEGRKELFNGLAIEKLETEWEQYPVLHFDMSLGKHMGKDGLERYLHHLLEHNEKRHGLPKSDAVDCNIRLTNLIMDVNAKTGKQVVILIDEYDAPLLDVVHEEVNLNELRQIMRNFYSPLKACEPYLKFVFLTGITKFSQLSIFSELNNIANISMLEDYAAVCGITEDEIRKYLGSDAGNFAAELGLSQEEFYSQLKTTYDGYHFSWPSPDVYNPFSLFNAFEFRRIDSFWFGSGTPTYLIEMLRKFHVPASEIGGRRVPANAFDAPTERMTSITPLLYQSGYLTIKNYNPQSKLYTLDYPNKEVQQGMIISLLPEYVAPPRNEEAQTIAFDIFDAINNGDMDEGLRLLQTFLSTVPYTSGTDTEGHYQQMLYVIFSLLGIYVDIEVRTPRGRVDVVLRTTTTLYVIELKLNKSADAAMQQIDLKKYPERFALCGLPIVKVGINFDSEEKTIADWKIEPSTC